LSDVLYPTPDVCLNNLGWAYYQKGEYRIALAQYQQALQRNTNKYLRFLIYKHMGIAYFALNEFENAIDYFERSLELVPNLQETHYWLGRCYLKVNDSRKAAQAFELAVTINPDSEYGARARKYLSVIPDN
jgi:type IV pilus assembly protein PilF